MRNGPYELIIAPEDYPGMKYRTRYAYEHHVVWWQHTGDIVAGEYVIHHKNGNKRDNDINNLEKQTRAEHTGQHNRVLDVETTCTRCGKLFAVAAHNFRSRMKRYGRLFCGRSCQVKQQQQERNSTR